MKNPIAGTTISDYVSNRKGALNLDLFERKLIDFLREHSQSVVLAQDSVQTLFGICDDHLRRMNGLASFDREHVLLEQAKALRFCENVSRQLEKLDQSLMREASELRHPEVAQVSELIARQMSAVQKRLKNVAAEIKQQRRIASDLRRMGSPKHSAYELVSDLDDYINKLYPGRTLPEKDKGLLIAAALFAMGMFTPQEVRGDVLDRIRQKRFNARKYIAQSYVNPHVQVVGGGSSVVENELQSSAAVKSPL